MTRRRAFVLFALVLPAVAACGGRRPVEAVRVPPRVDLKSLETIGVVEFDSTADGKLAALATRQFAEWARMEQGLIRMLEFGSRQRTLEDVGRETWDSETIRLLGREHDVRTVLEGELVVSRVRPDISVLPSLRSGQVSARVDATLSVRMTDTTTGASIWSSSAASSETVGHLSVLRGKAFSFDADDPEAAYGELVSSLVEQVTQDFRATWETR